MKKAVLSYSGGLDTSVCIPMMREYYGYDNLVTVTVDVGQPEADIKEAEEKAKALGTEHYTVDAKDEFVKDYIFPTIKANGNYQGYQLSTAIARPLIALKAVEVAKKVGAEAFCHGCTGKGNDQFRFEFVCLNFAPELTIIAPMRERNLTRIEEIEYAKQRGVPVGQSIEKIWSIDENLWGRSIEGGRLEEPDYTPPEEIYQWTKGPREAPNEPLVIEIGFEKGEPVSIDGKKMDGVSLIQALNEIAGEHGVGRVDIMEDRMLGLKVRENYEAPAAITLLTAHKALEALVCTKEERQFKTMVDQAWGEMAYNGLWFDPLKEDLEAFIKKIQERVTGTVKMQLFKGSAKVIGRSSPYALYNADLASFDTKTFDQREMTGAVKVHGLQSRMYWQLKKGK
ncbi:MAG TPA: argininosuccinate synthase [Armatimonadota bacterium]|nr:argininosuccinate synthase [Armatimonadota bacterium]